PTARVTVWPTRPSPWVFTGIPRSFIHAVCLFGHRTAADELPARAAGACSWQTQDGARRSTASARSGGGLIRVACPWRRNHFLLSGVSVLRLWERAVSQRLIVPLSLTPKNV